MGLQVYQAHLEVACLRGHSRSSSRSSSSSSSSIKPGQELWRRLKMQRPLRLPARPVLLRGPTRRTSKLPAYKEAAAAPAAAAAAAPKWAQQHPNGPQRQQRAVDQVVKLCHVRFGAACTCTAVCSTHLELSQPLPFRVVGCSWSLCVWHGSLKGCSVQVCTAQLLHCPVCTCVYRCACACWKCLSAAAAPQCSAAAASRHHSEWVQDACDSCAAVQLQQASFRLRPGSAV